MLPVPEATPQTPPFAPTQVQDPLTLVASTVTPKYGGNVSLIYRFEVRSGSTVVTSGTAVGSGSSVSFTPAAIEPDTNFTWRVRAEADGAFGPWSSDASFRSPVGAYIVTVDQISADTVFIQGNRVN